MAKQSTSDEKCISYKHLSFVLLALLVLALIPLIVIGFYNFPSADDFSMAFETHEKYLQTGSVFVTLGYAVYMGFWYYMNWTGYFFSAALTAMCPSIFNERLYFLTSIIVLGMVMAGSYVFFDGALVKKLGLSKYVSGALWVLTFLVMIESMPFGAARNEGFYWYSGSINYSFMFGFGLLWLGLLIRLSLSENKVLLVFACIIGFLLGGANYMTALSLAVVSFCIILIRVFKKITKIEGGYVLIAPALFNIAGLLVSAAAPGNRVRGEALDSLNPVVAILRSIYHVFDICINQWMRWEVVVMLLIVAVISFSAAKAVKIPFEHPFLFSVFCFLMVAVNIVPPLFATGSFEAGRMLAIIWMQFALMMVLIVFYNCVWLGQMLSKNALEKDCTDLRDTQDLSPAAGRAILSLFAVLAAGLLLSVYVDRAYITSTSAAADIISGRAAQYASENRQRLEILKNGEADTAELPEHKVKPELLFFGDITEDTTDWTNEAVADYYGKSEVKLVR